MIRRARLTHSGHPYAVEPETLRVDDRGPRSFDGQTIYGISVQAFWFKGRAGTPTANVGDLWGNQVGGPVPTLEGFLAAMDTRYGGACRARWDGTSLWGPSQPAKIEEALAFLCPALDAYPAIPAGYEGWWYAR